MFKKIMLTAVLSSLSSVILAKIPADAQAVISDLMMQHYGTKYDKKQQCYLYPFIAYAEYGGEKQLTCVKVIDSQEKNMNQTPTLFLTVAGDMVEEASRVESGLGGYFYCKNNKINGISWQKAHICLAVVQV